MSVQWHCRICTRMHVGEASLLDRVYQVTMSDDFSAEGNEHICFVLLRSPLHCLYHYVLLCTLVVPCQCHMRDMRSIVAMLLVGHHRQLCTTETSTGIPRLVVVFVIPVNTIEIRYIFVSRLLNERFIYSNRLANHLLS